MEKEVRMTRVEEVKKMLENGALPWWAALMLARQFPDEFSDRDLRHLHHCSDCGCAMMCCYKECRANEMLCEECGGKKSYFQGGKLSCKRLS